MKAVYHRLNLTPAGMLKKYAGKILMKIGVKNAPQVAAWLERVAKPLSEGISSSSVDVDEKSPLQKMLDMIDGNISNSNSFGGDFGFAGGKGNWEGKSGTGNDPIKHHEYSSLKKHVDRGYGECKVKMK